MSALSRVDGSGDGKYMPPPLAARFDPPLLVQISSMTEITR